MPTSVTFARRRVCSAAVAGLTASLLLAGCGGSGDGKKAAPAPAGSSTAPLAASPPQRLQIPAIGVDATVGQLGLNPDKTPEVPTDYNATGWYKESPTPGQIGPSEILGHVDSTKGPAVFYRLEQLQAGDEVDVVRGDGTTAVFSVTSIHEYPKKAFPTATILGDTPDPQLRLVTCGGNFNDKTHHYENNVVAFAKLTGTKHS